MHGMNIIQGLLDISKFICTEEACLDTVVIVM